MGSGSSVRRSTRSMMNEVGRLQERVIDIQVKGDEAKSMDAAQFKELIAQLQTEKAVLEEQLRDVRKMLKHQSEGWQKEHNKRIALMFCDLPLSLLGCPQTENTNVKDAALCKHFPMVTVAQCDVVGFDGLVGHITPQEAISLVDQLHTTIDEAFAGRELFIVERTYSTCMVASGLCEQYKAPPTCHSTTSMSDSSYGSEWDLRGERGCAEGLRGDRGHAEDTQGEAVDHTPEYYASVLASSVLQLLSLSSTIKVPTPLPLTRATPTTLLLSRNVPPTMSKQKAAHTSQLQIRASLHSGPCSAGVMGLTVANRTSRMPHYKLFGPTVGTVRGLCTSGLALQIRVSRQCHALLLKAGGFVFERCPDYTTGTSPKTVESYWLMAREGLPFTPPSIEKALPLSEYEDMADL